VTLLLSNEGQWWGSRTYSLEFSKDARVAMMDLWFEARELCIGGSMERRDGERVLFLCAVSKLRVEGI
jgi:hypothetical protein